MSVVIEVSGIALHGRHGVLEEERREGQEFAIDVSLELAREPARRVLPRTLDRVGELLAGGFGVPRRRELHRSLELLDGAPLELAEACMDPLRRLGLLALDPLAELALAAS